MVAARFTGGGMTEGNGFATDGMDGPRETVEFKIAGETVQVPAIYFDDTDAVKDTLAALSPNITWLEYADLVMKIVAHQLAPVRPDLTYDVIRRRTKAGEAQQLAGMMNDLLRASGFPIPEPTTEAAPATTENPGTGTSTGSAANSPSEESAEETPAA